MAESRPLWPSELHHGGWGHKIVTRAIYSLNKDKNKNKQILLIFGTFRGFSNINVSSDWFLDPMYF